MVMNGYCVINVFSPSWPMRIWCRALVFPIDTLTILLIEVSFAVVNPAMTAVDAILTKLDSNLPEFSSPDACELFLNL